MIKNMIKCKLCNDIIESKHRHDFVKCKCGKCFVDGGTDYQRIGYEKSIDVLIWNEIDQCWKELF